MDSDAKTRQCTLWLEKVFPQTTISTECTTSQKLCEYLSDGEVLCGLVNALSNSCTYDYPTYFSASSHVFARKNLVFFLTQCKDVFGLKEQDLFEPDELLEGINPDRVVQTLLTLARVSGGVEVNKAEVKSASGGSHVENVIKEICDQENALIEKLETLMKYRSELLGLLSLWSPELVSVVFQYTEPLYTVHKEMHAKLTSLESQGSQQFCSKLSDLMTEMMPKLEIYVKYFSDLPHANSRMESAFVKNPEMKVQLSLLDSHFKAGLNFRGLYDGPIRQTTNYLQFVIRLQKCAQKENYGPEITKSLDNVKLKIEALLNKANTFKRQAEQLGATKEILGPVNDLPKEYSDADFSGLHLADDYFKVRTSKDKKAENQLSQCILTTKQLILAKKDSKDSPAVYWFSIPITNTLQVKKCDRSLELGLENGDKVIMKSDCPGVDKWIGHLNATKEFNCPEGWDSKGHSFKRRTFACETPCSRCSQELTGITMQGYDCSHCNKQLHQECFKQYIGLRASDFYHRNMVRGRAEEILANQIAGTFLIRDSNTVGVRALSLKSDKNKIEHIIINESEKQCTMGSAPTVRSSLDDLLDYYHKNKMSENFHAIDCYLGDGIEVTRVPTG